MKSNDILDVDFSERKQIIEYIENNVNVKEEDGWFVVNDGEDGKMYRNKRKGLLVIISISIEEDNNNWVHVSFSRKSRMPDYSDITLIKKLFIGEDKKAIMVFPAKKEHINIHKYCLHLFCCIDNDSLPDFTQGKGTL